MPRVTVLMPVFNVEKYIREAIDSILNQTFSDFILLILDDYSTDNTAKIVSEYTDQRIKYYKQDKNVGLSENLNTGVALADTEYLARMDGDDISVATCLEKQINFLDTHPDIDICSVGFQFFGAKNSTVIFPENHEDIKAAQIFGNCIILPMFRRQFFTDNNLKYKTDAFPAEDYRMWSECLMIGKAYNLQEVLFYYRMHPEQISTEKKQKQAEKANEVRLFLYKYLSTNVETDFLDFYLNKFCAYDNIALEDIKKIKDFGEFLIKENSKSEHFEGNALKRQFVKQLSYKTYSLVVNKYFTNAYNPISFLKYLNTGVFLYVSFKLNTKLLIKSLLFKK